MGHLGDFICAFLGQDRVRGYNADSGIACETLETACTTTSILTATALMLTAASVLTVAVFPGLVRLGEQLPCVPVIRACNYLS